MTTGCPPGAVAADAPRPAGAAHAWRQRRTATPYAAPRRCKPRGAGPQRPTLARERRFAQIAPDAGVSVLWGPLPWARAGVGAGAGAAVTGRGGFFAAAQAPPSSVQLSAIHPGALAPVAIGAATAGCGCPPTRRAPALSPPTPTRQARATLTRCRNHVAARMANGVRTCRWRAAARWFGRSSYERATLSSFSVASRVFCCCARFFFTNI